MRYIAPLTMKCPKCKNEYKYLKYDLFCPVCLRAIPQLLNKQYETNQKTKGSGKKRSEVIK